METPREKQLIVLLRVHNQTTKQNKRSQKGDVLQPLPSIDFVPLISMKIKISYR